MNVEDCIPSNVTPQVNLSPTLAAFLPETLTVVLLRIKVDHILHFGQAKPSPSKSYAFPFVEVFV